MQTRTETAAGLETPAAMTIDPELPDVRGGIRLLARLARVAERTSLESGVSLPQYRLLVSASGAPQRVSDLAESVGVSRPTLTALVDGLAQAGLAKRVPEPTDRRGIRLELTDAGRAAMERAEVALTKRLVSLVDGDVHAVLAQLSEVIETLTVALERESAERRG